MAALTYSATSGFRRGMASPLGVTFLALHPQRLDAGQGLALHPFEEGAAGGRDVGEVVLDAGMGERRDGVAAAGDRDQLPGMGAGRDVLGDLDRAGIERRGLEGAERAVPDQRSGLVDRALDALDRLRADIEDHAVGSIASRP